MSNEVEDVTVARRSFRIHSHHGSSRQWRSRKDRPCDTCRKRKTACIISAKPPCQFCQSRSLPCEFATSPTQRQRRRYSTAHTSRHAYAVDASYSDPAGHDSAPLTDGTVQDTESVGDVHLRQHHVEPFEHRGLSDASTQHVQVFAEASPAESISGRTPPYTPQTYLIQSDGISPMRTTSTHFGCRNSTRLVAESDDSGFLTLEDGKNLTAHSIGPSGEQDTDLLASFRSNTMNETDRVDMDVIQVFEGDPARAMPPVHFSLIHDEFPIYDEKAKQCASDAIELKVEGYRDALVRLYFRFVHPVFPVMSKGRFLRSFTEDRLSISPALRGSIYGLAQPYWAHDTSLPPICPFTQVELFEQVHASLQRELDAPNFSNLQACLLSLHEQPASNGTTETPRMWTLAGQAVACAQMIGLHRDPNLWNIAPWEKSLRKKLWWATYMADKWSSISHGNPPHIHSSTFDTKEADLSDVAVDEDVDPLYHRLLHEDGRVYSIATGARFIEHVKLTRILDELLETSFSLDKYRFRSQRPDTERLLLSIKSSLDNWRSLLPQSLTMDFQRRESCWHNNGPLQLAYYGAKVLLFRALMTPATVTARLDPMSSIRRYFSVAIVELGAFNEFISKVDVTTFRAFWGRHARTKLILCGNFMIYLFVSATGPTETAAAFKLLEDFHDALQRLSTMADHNNIGLIRPTALRVDSFFAQAAKIMRAGPGGEIMSRSPLNA